MTTATLTITTIPTQQAGVPFQVTGTAVLSDPSWLDTLVYADVGGAATPSPAMNVTASLNISSFTFSHPGLPAGTYNITVSGPFGSTATSNTFTVLGAKAVVPNTPASVVAGVPFTFTGTLVNYLSAPALTYKPLFGASTLIPSGDVTSSGWSTPVTLPAGTFNIAVSADGTVAGVTANFTVTAPAKAINPVTSPSVTAGATFQFTGALVNYTTAPQLTYRIGNASPLPVTGVTATTWAMTLVAPSVAGTYALSVTDGTITNSTTLTVVAAQKVITPQVPGTVTAGQTFTFAGVLTNYTAVPALTYSLDLGPATPVTGVTATGWSMTLTAPSVAGPHSLTVSDGTITSNAASFSAIAAPPPSVLRSWLQNPGEDGMFWNKPFQTTANFITSGPLVTLLRNGTGSSPQGHLHVGPGDFAAPFYVGGPNDPQCKVTDGVKTIFVRIPVGAVIETPSTPSDNSIGGLDATQPYLLWSGSGCTMTNLAGSTISAVPAGGAVINVGYGMSVCDASGQLMMDAVTGIPGSLNSFGGITEYDLQQALADPNFVVQHMWAAILDPAMVSSAGPVWPLKIIDNSFPNTGGIPQGCTFAIAPNDAYPTAKIGNRAFKLLWDQHQQFGTFYYNVGSTGSYQLFTFPLSTATATFAGLLSAEMNDLAAHLVILNPGDAASNYTTGVTGSQFSLATQKGSATGSSDAWPSPPPLDLSPTNGVNVAPSTFGAWYNTTPPGYNRVPQNSTQGGGGTPPQTLVTWSPTDKSAAVTVTNANRTATSTGSAIPGTALQGIRGSSPITASGNVVLWQVSADALTPNWSTGVADASWAFDTTNLGEDIHGMGYYASTGTGSQPPQTVYFGGMQLSAGNGQASAAGDVVTCATNGTAMWFSDAAMRSSAGVQWNNSTTADPVKGIGGYPLSGIGTPFYPSWSTNEGGSTATINDGSAALSAFGSTYLAANSSVVTLSGQTPPAAARSIAVNAPQGVIVGQPINLSGVLTGYTTVPALTYRVDGGTATAVTGETLTGFTTTVAGVTFIGSHTIVVTDGTVTGTVTFNAASAGGAPVRVTAPLTGTVTTQGWLAIDVTFSGVTMPSGKPAHFNVLPPANYAAILAANPNTVWPVLFWLHPNDEGNGWYDGSNGDPTYLAFADANGFYNNVAFLRANPAWIVVPYCDQTTNPGGDVTNFGGWAPNGTTGSGTNSNGVTGPNPIAVQQFALMMAKSQSITFYTQSGANTATRQNVTLTVNGDSTRLLINGFSLGGIGTEYQMRTASAVNGNPKVWAAGVSYAGVLQINGFGAGPNANDVTASMAPPIWNVSGAQDTESIPSQWNQPMWRAIAGNSNYPAPNGTAAQAQAGNSNWHYWQDPNLGHSQGTYPTNSTLLNWLFSQVSGSVAPIPNITGLTISAATGVHNSPIGTAVGNLTATVTAGTLTGTTFTLPSTGSGTGHFVARNNTILDPNGNPYKGSGMNVSNSQFDSVATNSAAQPLTSLFPNVSIVRLAFFGNNSQNFSDPNVQPGSTTVNNFITRLTSNRIVVIVENHAFPQAGSVSTGTKLQQEAAWLASYASFYIGNPYVWFQAGPNEPVVNGGVGSQDLVSQEALTCYNVIRATGNANPIVLEVIGGGVKSYLGTSPTSGNGLTPSAYAGMTNIVWDLHQYANGITTQASILADLQDNVRLIQQIRGADPGLVPVLIGEYGPSQDGSGGDNVNADMPAVQSSGLSTVAWAWFISLSLGDNLTNGNNTLSSYGQQVAGYIATQSVVPAGSSSFKVVGNQVQFASATVTAGSYPLPITVAATNAGNSPQTFNVTVTVT